ncbi:eukaryotic translation initiation factor 2-alpha kinase 1-like [Venturia canescens]|uniref:eukaryotic translation initiation factor 2-alpha kinase 1-like n=1 Tax=Venturia canescens TaxID=32260 RepID=UPI001C9D21DE|nr:eukaryotic translation initiation factor 2-alpha kinase 1-like [Venturia canescens]
MAGKPHENNPWSTLSTVSTFDKGNHSWTTRYIEESDVQTSGQIVGRVAPATSLLIESLIQQLCTMFEGDTLRRNKLYYAICDRLHEMKLIDGSYNKIEFETMRGQYQVALYKLVAVARALTGSESSLQVPNCLIAECSRYRREFNEIGFIAAGGFGDVFKAQHRLDGNVYAIKKIIVRSGRVKTIMKHLEEVKTIARLNHTNIVSYKGAWIEQSLAATFIRNLPACDGRSDEKSFDSKNISTEKSEERNDSSSSIESCQSESESPSESNKPSNTEKYTYTTGRRISERLSSRLDDEEEDSDVVSFRSETRESKIINSHGNMSHKRESSTEETNGMDNVDDSESCEETTSGRQLCTLNSSSSPKFATLYIQMALCDQTLRQWLDERNEPTPTHIVTAIVTQILNGLEYIHSLDIVHHDIKPSNIFISKSGNLQIQLGDFGLACPLQREGHHSALGTPTYAAPEQLRGICDPKSDVYSVGIVLLELLVPMQTHMERSRVMTALKKGQLPASLNVNYPQWAQVILKLVQENSKKRPSPTELLKILSEDKDSIIARLKEENDKKDDLIHELQDKIASLKATIEKLKISSDYT